MSETRIILFRCHADVEIARNRIEILKHYNPDVPVHVLYGGSLDGAKPMQDALGDVIDSFWAYPKNKDKSWKWMHTDIMTKEWFRAVGHRVSFDYLYSYEYDILTLAPLVDIYPQVSDGEIALSAAEEFTERIESKWAWTSQEPMLGKYRKFQKYMQDTYGISRQEKVCLGPGPLLSRKFLEAFTSVEDIDYVHEEMTFPAYAQAFGIGIKNNNLHPGFFAHSDEDEYFTCVQNKTVSMVQIEQCIQSGKARRSFHPVKYMVTLEDAMRLSIDD